jgi:hypothetical protein
MQTSPNLPTHLICPSEPVGLEGLGLTAHIRRDVGRRRAT